MIKIALGVLLGFWLTVGSLELVVKIVNKHEERKERKAAKKLCKKCQEEIKLK